MFKLRHSSEALEFLANHGFKCRGGTTADQKNILVDIAASAYVEVMASTQWKHQPLIPLKVARELMLLADQTARDVHTQAYLDSKKPLKVFTSNDFTGHYPVGAALVVTAHDEATAIELAQIELKKCGLTFNGTMQELPAKTSTCVVLCDGNY